MAAHDNFRLGIVHASWQKRLQPVAKTALPGCVLYVVGLIKDEHRLVKRDVHGASNDRVQEVAVWAEHKICLTCTDTTGITASLLVHMHTVADLTLHNQAFWLCQSCALLGPEWRRTPKQVGKHDC